MLGKYVAFDDPEKEVAIELSSGRIQGRVVDGTGAAVAGALVSATQQFSEPRATSFARNRSDGTVEILCSGTTKAVEGLVGQCARGPAGARIANLELHKAEPPAEKGFNRRPSV